MKIPLIFFVMIFSITAFASTNSHPQDPVTPVIFWVTLIFLFGVIGRNIARRLNQPGVLGELLMGILVGNLCYYFGSQLIVLLREGSSLFSVISDMLAGQSISSSVNASIHNNYYAEQVISALSLKESGDLIKVAYVVDMFSRYGVIFLLFMVGLDTSVDELGKTGTQSICVAVIGVVAPIIFGVLVTTLLLPELLFKSDLFISATLCATSIGITARVLSELNIINTREARTILGAAMLDDILGLVILAIVSSLVITGAVNIIEVGYLILSSLLFFSCSLLIGPLLLRKAARAFNFFEPWEEKLFISFVFFMGLAWIASLASLAPIMGAFAAGIILNDSFFRTETEGRNSLKIRELMAPLESIFTPVFFMMIGFQVKIESFANIYVLVIATGLILAAVAGKLVCGLGASSKDNRLFIGIGMLPRGEVGLVFATIGRTIGVISDELFSAVILMVIVTTLLAPPLLKMCYAKKNT